MAGMSGGIMPWLRARPGEIKECNEQAHYIVKIVNEVQVTGKPLLCTGDFMRKGWRFQYNPEKNESPESELNRYLEGLSYKGIGWHYDQIKDEYYFYKITKDHEPT